MQNITIDISKSELVKSAESLLWKYGVATDVEKNAKSVNNVKADSVSRPVDARVLKDSFDKRFEQVTNILMDFITDIQHGGYKNSPISVLLSFSSRWKGKATMLQEAVNKYILDGMMVDWLNVTAPSEATTYLSQIDGDKKNITNIAYSLGKPEIA